MEKIDLLKNVNLGARIAEDEADSLSKYFVKTEYWRQLIENKVDVIYGSKGSGKSALYGYLNTEVDALYDKNTLLVNAENPTGSTVFASLKDSPNVSETQLESIWKLYILTLIIETAKDYGLKSQNFDLVRNVLEDCGIIPRSKNLRSILIVCLDYIKRITNPEAIETSININESTGQITGCSFKICLTQPSNSDAQNGVRSIDELFESINNGFVECGYSLWIAIDRLDVAFSENENLEKTALRSLFKVYRDLAEYSSLRLKIFLRNDIWKKITREGFREASHITKTMTIKWSKEDLMNLIVSRLLNNKSICDYYGVNKSEVMNSFLKQEEMFYKIFPRQIDVGPNKPSAFDWVYSRVKDGQLIVAPREIIHLITESFSEQIKRIERGINNIQDENLVERSVFKEAIKIVSKVRIEQTIYAEYPGLRDYIEKLTSQKAEQTIETLSRLWNISNEETEKIAKQLNEIGFFELKGDLDLQKYWVPFIYREDLNLVQGIAV